MVMKHILFDEKSVNCDIKIIFVSYYKTTNERKNMAKKKKAPQQRTLSPERYIKEKARLLPIAECWITNGWDKFGSGTVIVARQHKNGNYTLGVYMFDTFCCGLTDSLYYFNVSEYEYKEILEESRAFLEMDSISYEEVHNLVYGVIAFAEEAGLSPHSSFKLTQYILEEDTEEIPLIEYEFGKDGKHFLVATSRFQVNTLLPLMKKNLGDNFSYVLREEDDDEEEEYDEYEDYDEDPLDSDAVKDILEALGRIQTIAEEQQMIPITPYSYVHLAYPAVLDVQNKQLITLLYNNDSCLLPDATIRDILSLPRESLIRDLEQMALFETGCTCDEISEERREERSPNILLHASFFLAELRAEDSLAVILELLRQREEFFDYYFGDTGDEVFVPTLYLLGQNRLPQLLEFMKEPGLYTFARCHVAPAVALIARLQPERREEVIEWFRQVLTFFTENLADNIYCDGTLAGMLVSDLLDIRAEELLPEIKAMYTTGLVDRFCCGNYAEVEDEFFSSGFISGDKYSLDIYERYRAYHKRWGD